MTSATVATMLRACFVLLLGGCAITSRVAAGYGAMADSGSCGGALTAVAVAIDGAVAGAILASGEISDAEQVAIGALAADAFIGGVMALQDCFGD